MDELEKIYADAIKSLDDKLENDIPSKVATVIRDTLLVTRSELPEGFHEYGDLDDVFLQVEYDIELDDGEVIVSRDFLQINDSRFGALARFKKLYGNPEAGTDIIAIRRDGSEFFNIKLK